MKKLLIVLWIMASLSHIYGQDVPQVTNKIFIKNATLTTHPGADPVVGHILIEDGLISDIGPNVTQPFDARIVKGDSMHVYAGFVATLSHIGLKEPKEDNQRPKVDRTGYPPNDIAGITPEKGIQDLYLANEGSISDFRKQGFVLSHTVPYGKMMPGQGSVISLGGAKFNQAVISRDNSMYAQWSSARGVFPATLIGIMAKWREMYKNAELSMAHASSYKANPLNKSRPSHDAATEALFPVINKQMSVYFSAEKHRDIHRTLRLQKDLGFNLVLTEVRDVDRILDQVKESGAGVLLSLDLPDEEKEKKKEKDDAKEGEGKEDAAKDDSAKDDSAKDDSAKDEKLAELTRRQKEAVDRYVGQARMLAEQGVPFAFSYLDAKPKDIHPNLRRLIKDGLSSSDALGALTTQPAATLGISNIAGTLDKGKIGNIVMTTGPLFDEKSKIKMVIVDGKIHSYDVKEKKKKSSGEAIADVSGDWSYKIEVPGMTPSGTMTFTKNGDTYDLTVTSSQNPGESVSTTGIELDGNNMVFNYTMSAGGMNISVDNDITFDGNTFEGNVSVADFGSFEINGKKSDPE